MTPGLEADALRGQSWSVDLSVDVRVFVEAFRRFSAAMNRVHDNCRRVATPAFVEGSVPLRRAADREEIRQLALVHRGELAAWLDRRAEQIYGDLGLRRPPSNLIRGEE